MVILKEKGKRGEEMLKKYGLSTIITAIVALFYYYFMLPPINWRSGEFWVFLFFLAIVWFVCYHFAASGTRKIIKFGRWRHPDVKSDNSAKPIGMLDDFRAVRKIRTIGIVVICVAAAVFAVVFVSSSKLFNAKKYQAMLNVQNSDFTSDIAEIPFSQIPVVDKDTAERLGSRKIGEVVELVSQFDVAEYYTQINVAEKPVRVSPLEYAGLLKWFVNKKEGIPYYVKIDMATQNTDLVELDEGMKYSPSEYFSRDLMRHVRLHCPTKMFEEISFEIDDSGRPYWVLPYYTYTIGILGGKNISGIVLVDAVTGKITDYPVKEVPTWIDRVYPASMVLDQAHSWGTLINGYWNSIFTQKNVVVTTDGYNYLALNDDVWLYTGITSVVSDQSNIGFILINMRTKESKKFDINGAEEYSAMGSAEGMIQEKGYKATFPILMNIGSVPSYFISLKDNAGLVKAYSFVSVENYQIVGVGDTIDTAKNEYIRLLNEYNIIDDSTLEGQQPPEEIGETVEGIVTAVTTAVVDGNSVYYIQIGENIYKAGISVSDKLPFLKAGDNVKLTVKDGNVKALQ